LVVPKSMPMIFPMIFAPREDKLKLMKRCG
jgi:hypothetical protein